MFMDANDIASTTMSFMPKDLENLVTGINTYGFSECIMYYESVLWDLWMFYAEAHGTGMGYGIVLASLTSRLIFAPLAIYSVSATFTFVTHLVFFVALSKRSVSK